MLLLYRWMCCHDLGVCMVIVYVVFCYDLGDCAVIVYVFFFCYNLVIVIVSIYYVVVLLCPECL